MGAHHRQRGGRPAAPPDNRENHRPEPRDPVGVRVDAPAQPALDQLGKEQLRSIVHERWREDARCMVELLIKLVLLVAVLAALVSGASNDILETVKGML